MGRVLLTFQWILFRACSWFRADTIIQWRTKLSVPVEPSPYHNRKFGSFRGRGTLWETIPLLLTLNYKKINLRFRIYNKKRSLKNTYEKFIISEQITFSHELPTFLSQIYSFSLTPNASIRNFTYFLRALSWMNCFRLAFLQMWLYPGEKSLCICMYYYM
jgi:hypothetical protein